MVLVLCSRRHMEIFLSVISLQSNVSYQIKLRECILHLLHSFENKISSSLRFTIRTNVDVAIFFVIWCPVFDTGQHKFRRLWLCSPYLAEFWLQGYEGYSFVHACSSEYFYKGHAVKGNSGCWYILVVHRYIPSRETWSGCFLTF